jgi:glucosamine--fructose-6-phosphate aminotransferase (isomerizing)
MMQSNLEKEIYQQPEILSKLIAEQSPKIEKLAEQLRSYSPRFIIIAARGTSDHAAVYAKYLFSCINLIPTGLAMPSLHTLYRVSPDFKGGLVIGISQSGQTPDVRAVMEAAQQQGVPTIAITNVKDSPLSATSDHTILMDVGGEKSVAASKTFTSQLAAVAMLAAYYSENEQLIAELDLLPGYMQSALEQRPVAQAIAKRFALKNHAVIVGRGFNHCTTQEIALKIKELSYMFAQPYSAADFRHGPIAILEPGIPVLTIAMRGNALADMESMIDDIRWTDADLAIMTNVDWLDHYSSNIIRMPEELPDWLSPIVCTVPGQLLALHLALEKGLDPDKPRGLNKVTLTY